MQRLLIVGLWCANPDYKLRPSIRKATGVLNFEAPLPVLPVRPTYLAQAVNKFISSFLCPMMLLIMG